MSEYQSIDPTLYGLSSRTVIVELGNNRLGIVKKRKSRIIMKDGYQIKDMADIIRKNEPNVNLARVHCGPICSKTTKFLKENDISILHEE